MSNIEHIVDNITLMYSYRSLNHFTHEILYDGMAIMMINGEAQNVSVTVDCMNKAYRAGYYDATVKSVQILEDDLRRIE